MRYQNPDKPIGNAEKAVLHIAKAELKLSREDYEAVLWGAAKVRSSKDLTYGGYGSVMDRFKELGFSTKKTKMRPFTEPVPGRRVARGVEMATPEQQAKIYALWESFARVKTPDALKSFLKKRFGVASMSWLTKAKAVEIIEALKSMAGRQACRTR
jgi:hypothetical protein